MNTATDPEHWRNKYFDSLQTLEGEQQRFRSIEAALKRVAGRLCSASLGQSPALDDQIRKLQSLLRGETNSDALDRITPALTSAIQELDATPAAASPAMQPAPSVAQDALDATHDERVRAILAAVLTELRRDTELATEIEAVDSKLGAALPRAQLPDVLSSVADLVARRIQRVESARQEIETLLTHMVGKLDEIGHFVAEQNRTQTQSQASSETLNVQLASEIRAMGESVDAANDLQQIRHQVRSRIESIDRHLLAFREREAALTEQMRERSEQMQMRIVELEQRATRLHDQLKTEQRQSMFDALTRVPNRLAYDQRIDEEMRRWQRFAQPTCLVVWDVDHFKRINDSYGHRAGDRVLRIVAECLTARIRATDFLARYGGEEFVMILAGSHLADAINVIDKIRTAVAQLGFHFRGTPVSITLSAGVTEFQAEDSAESVFDRADKALYRAKQNGRNCSVSG